MKYRLSRAEPWLKPVEFWPRIQCQLFQYVYYSDTILLGSRKTYFFSIGLLFALDSEASLSVRIRNTNVQIHPLSVSYFLHYFSYVPTFIHPPLKVTWKTSSYCVKPHTSQINKSGPATHNTFACKHSGVHKKAKHTNCLWDAPCTSWQFSGSQLVAVPRK